MGAYTFWNTVSLLFAKKRCFDPSITLCSEDVGRNSPPPHPLLPSFDSHPTHTLLQVHENDWEEWEWSFFRSSHTMRENINVESLSLNFTAHVLNLIFRYGLCQRLRAESYTKTQKRSLVLKLRIHRWLHLYYQNQQHLRKAFNTAQSTLKSYELKWGPPFQLFSCSSTVRSRWRGRGRRPCRRCSDRCQGWSSRAGGRGDPELLIFSDKKCGDFSLDKASTWTLGLFSHLARHSACKTV